MSFIRAENKKTVDVLVANVNACAATIERGFDMRTESSLLKKISQDIDRGLFKILFMGKFKTGKSTIINAFVGKAVMATKAVACTAVIAAVKYGNDTDSVRVVYTPESRRPPERFGIDQFAKDFAIKPQEEQRLIKNGGELERFANVAYAEMFSTNKLFADGICLIDSPGLEEDISRTAVTKKFLPEANAIVFMLDATALFSAKEREYIADNFTGKRMTNLFFVVNKINQVIASQVDLVESKVKENLQDVFADDDGNFDEELYNRRVFFVDAYGAQCARTGEPYKIKVGKREMEVPVALEDTGMPAFENELRAFLNSDERIDALINSTLAVMEINRANAEQKFKRAKKIRETNIHEREAELSEAQKNLVDAKELLKKFPAPIEQTADKISTKAYSYLAKSIEDIEREFEDRHMDGFVDAVDWGSLALLGTATFFSGIPFIGKKLFSDEELEKFAKPIAEFMQETIRFELDRHMAHLTTRIELPELLAALEQNLDEQIQQFDLQLEKAANVKDSLRSALIMSNWGINFSENSRQMTGALPISFEWFGSIVSTVTAAVAIVISAVWLLLTPITFPVIIVGALAFCIKEGLDADTMKKNFLSLVVSKTFDKLKDHIFNERHNIKANISRSVLPLMSARIEKIVSTAKNLIDDADRTLKNLLAEKVDAAAAANARDESNLREVAAQIDNVRKQLTRVKNYQ